ncbi:MAG: WYL domain-containing protein [Armatimonadetes bacterium]|nr:WYL domain-containing protein [Armatimonadota bacterium]
MSKSTLLIEMINVLRERPGVRIEELASAVRRSERTVYRWLREISGSLGMPICCKDGGYYLRQMPDKTLFALTPQELLAFRLSLTSSPFREGSPVREYAESAWNKIKDAVVSECVEVANGMARTRSVSVTTFQAELPPGLVETLDRAVDRKRRLKIIYRSQKSRRVGEYNIDPYALVFKRHSWYLVGYCHEHQKVIHLKLARFIGAAETGDVFEPPADFSVDEYFASSWESWAGGEPVKVCVRFDSEVADMVSEVKRHPSQVVYPQSDGGIIFEVTVSGIEEIASWVMGYGKHAIVLEPASLRAYMNDHARGMVANYERWSDTSGAGTD